MQFKISKRDTAIMAHLSECAQAASENEAYAGFLPQEVTDKLVEQDRAFREQSYQLKNARAQHRILKKKCQRM